MLVYNTDYLFYFPKFECSQGENYRGAFWFIVLLNFKHIYLYLAPAYFVYLLKHFCLRQNTKLALKRFIKLGIIVIGVSSISFGPFVLNGQILQVLLVYEI